MASLLPVKNKIQGFIPDRSGIRKFALTYRQNTLECLVCILTASSFNNPDLFDTISENIGCKITSLKSKK
jgi:hypothetical protein